MANGVHVTLWHQSQEATDCRWVKILATMVGGKLKFPRGMENEIREILEYPNWGDQRKVRPSIRAAEMTPSLEVDVVREQWASSFWIECFEKTRCVPEGAVNKKSELRQQQLIEENETVRKYYFQSVNGIRQKLIDHLFATCKDSSIDSRHESAFGFAMYGLILFVEIIFYGASLSITGRVVLRMLIEVYITFQYLLKKERDDLNIWTAYRNYGIGKMKLIYLKSEELSVKARCIDEKEIEHIANEDQWIEFVPINLGHWDSVDLRKMSEEVGLKELYDKCYDYSSGFVHGNWGAIRESVYQKCINPMHRLHRLPQFDLPLMPSVVDDARDTVNGILECLAIAYPTFSERLKAPLPSVKESDKENVPESASGTSSDA